MVKIFMYNPVIFKLIYNKQREMLNLFNSALQFLKATFIFDHLLL